MRPNAPQIFISYSHDDAKVVKYFIKALEKELFECRIRPWIDSDDIRPGEEWAKKIEETIESCHVFVVFISQDTLDCPNVNYEIGNALCHSRILKDGTLIPVLIGGKRLDELPKYLQSESTIDGSDMRFDQLESHILSRIRSFLSDDNGTKHLTNR